MMEKRTSQEKECGGKYLKWIMQDRDESTRQIEGNRGQATGKHVNFEENAE